MKKSNNPPYSSSCLLPSLHSMPKNKKDNIVHAFYIEMYASTCACMQYVYVHVLFGCVCGICVVCVCVCVLCVSVHASVVVCVVCVM